MQPVAESSRCIAMIFRVLQSASITTSASYDPSKASRRLPRHGHCARRARGAEHAETLTFIKPDEAGSDFKIQGEYAGETSAAQVIALGGGKFHIVGWKHGLPGTVPNAEKHTEVDAVTEGGKVKFSGNGWKGEITDGVLTGTSDEGKTWKLKRIVRESPTLGAKPPADAIVLFDGTNADAFDHGKMDERHLLWSGPKTKQKFQAFHLHAEFLLPFKPFARGQARGNSGVYLQDRYEIQVLDSFGLKGESNECGGIYSRVKPKLNMCFPPLQWQTYDADFTPAQFGTDGKKIKNAVATVKHNGVLIHENQEIEGSTGGGQKETPEPGAIQLQGHGNPVFFRNVWIVEKK